MPPPGIITRPDDGAGTDAKGLDYTKLFGAFGVVFRGASGDQAVADECPFCGKEKFL